MSSREPRHSHEPGERWVERGTDIERTVFFSDAVFAIAITLLALEIRVPDVSDKPAVLREAFLALGPMFFSFFISFWFVGTYWVAHHRVFHHIGGYDRRLLFINLLFLMWIVLLPFSSSLLGEYGDQRDVVILYAAHVGLAGLSLQWVWWYASRYPHLMDRTGMDEREYRYSALGLSVPLVFLLSIGISFLRFLLELCALGAVGYWGFKTGGGMVAKIGLGIGAPLVVAVVWAVFVSPRAPVHLPLPLSLLLQAAIFGLAAAALAATEHRTLAWASVAVVINAVLMYVWGQ